MKPEPYTLAGQTYSLGGPGDYFALLKPRVMSLVIFTAFVGMIAAPGALNPALAAVSLFAIAVGAGASGALNMWWDADIDQVMKRTKSRPIPAGKVDKGEALSLGLALSGMSVIMLALATNVFAGAFLAFTIFFYVVVYTMWLKRATPQNIVIGGAAGAFPPVIGWIAATGSMSIEPWLMFALTFLWTPPHFWALALFMRNDYDMGSCPAWPGSPEPAPPPALGLPGTGPAESARSPDRSRWF